MRVRLLRGRASTYKWRIRFEGDELSAYSLFSCDTENAGLVAAEDGKSRSRRFRTLSFGKSGGDARAIVDMELIWMVAIVAGGLSPGGFAASLRGWAPMNDAFEKTALEQGVDYQVGAYLEGVPLEHVLPDVRFEGETGALDYPWPSEA